VLTINLNGLPEFQTALREFSARRLNAAVSTSLTRGAKEMAGQWQEQIDRRIDRPIARTKSATTFQSATAATLQSRVLVKDQLAGTPPSEYLSPQERAGNRNLKKFEQALQASGAMPRGWVVVPGRGASLDAYGNVSRSQIIAVITQLGTDYSPGYARVIPKTIAGRLRVMAKRGKSYIAVQPGDEVAKRISPGIYESSVTPDVRQANWWRGALKAVFLFKRTARYRKVLDLEAHAAKNAPDVISEEFGIAVVESFARLQASRAGG
jgi:hypothetical protein